MSSHSQQDRGKDLHTAERKTLFLPHADFPLNFWCRFHVFQWFAGLTSATELKSELLGRGNIPSNISKAQLQRISNKKVRLIPLL